MTDTTEKKILDWTTYRTPTEETKAKHEAFREAVREYMRAIDDLCPEGRDKALAMTHAEASMFSGNAAIARSIPL